MSVFDNPKFKNHLDYSWLNGLESENVEKPDYVKILTPISEEKSAPSKNILRFMIT